MSAFLHYIQRLDQYLFLFGELVKRDFKKRYKRTVLGVLWSLLSPLLMLFVISIVFSHFFGREIPHFVIYVFAGIVNFYFFTEATNNGMRSFANNAGIISSSSIPKYILTLSCNMQAFINYLLTLIIFLIFVQIDGLSFSWKYLALLFPIFCLTVFNTSVGLILASIRSVFKDAEYLYAVFTQIMLYFSAIFYCISTFATQVQHLFHLNPLYIYITYFRMIVIESTIPPLSVHLLGVSYAFAMLGIGVFVYRKMSKKIIYFI